jgi:vacuolar-type H+-ATPase subunit H
MEEVLKRLLAAEMSAEARVEEADEARRQNIQQALDEVRQLEADFERQVEARRKPFLAAAEAGAQLRVDEMHEASAAHQRQLRELAARNESAAIAAALALILGEIDASAWNRQPRERKEPQ